MKMILHTLCGINRCHHELICIAISEAHMISQSAQEKRKRQALGSSVPLSEWVKHIKLMIKVSYFIN